MVTQDEVDRHVQHGRHLPEDFAEAGALGDVAGDDQRIGLIVDGFQKAAAAIVVRKFK